MATEAASVLVATIDSLARRAPAIIASAARELGSIRLGLHFGDGSLAMLAGEHSRLVARRIETPEPADVEVYFDDRSLARLFDGSGRPAIEALESSLDMRGSREDLLAAWRCFVLLSQRASGLRAVQAIWSEYRDSKGEWAPPPPGEAPDRRLGEAFWEQSQWPALEWLDRRHPAAVELIERGEPVLAPARSLWDGRQSGSWQDAPLIFDNDLDETMARCKGMVVDQILTLIPEREPKAELYDLMRDYVTREGKGLRPTLVIATCLALGGKLEDGVRAAAALEMFHNGFLVHDDIADESTHRRGRPTLHMLHGVGLAVNAGDAMHLFAVDLVLSNLASLGLARTLGLIHEILHMCRETVEGQAIELGWIHRNVVPPADEDYGHMSTKKTGWYTCISPCRVGAAAAGVTSPEWLDRFNEAFRLIGIAFQTQDDILNLIGETALYGKEALGDLLEGKRTIMMIHLFRTAAAETVERMSAINAMPRLAKDQSLAEEMLAAMQQAGSIDYAIRYADDLANRGVVRFEEDLDFISENPGKAVLRQIANYVTTRAL
ncbi:MAG: polyprenyl synthetase [Alphaproteobacteria bacterium]|nr:polyprenyl synthetase [Alphaproteobacteria bacterium]MDB5722898.1 polyprenyl synthetase [Alphaproteobacteria bacterium]